MNSTTFSTRLRQLQTLPAQWVRSYNTRKPRKPSTGFQGPEGHGEKIWVWAHRRTEATIYTFRNRLDGFHDLKQLTFTGKKTKPAKLRKDYWSPIAVINFPAGQGSVGRSVFQKMRELKHRHELEWPEDVRYKRPEEYTEEERARVEASKKPLNILRTVKERGVALQRQRANTIADMAALLAGHGKGNLVAGSEGLVPVTVSWAKTWDQNYAQEWSHNVTHEEMPAAEAVEVVEDAAAAVEDAAVLDAATTAKPIQPTMA